MFIYKRNILIVLLVFISSCSSFIYDVADISQYTRLKRELVVPKARIVYNCGPEALASVLGYHGVKVTVEEVQAEIYNPRIKGTVSTNLAPYARKKGLYCTYHNGSFKKIKESINNDLPPIIMVKLGKDLFHFLVVTGYSETEKKILCRDFGTRKWIFPLDELYKRWEPAGYFYLEITTRSNYEVLKNTANDALYKNDYKRALKYFKKAWDFNKEDPELLNNYAHVLVKLKKDLNLAYQLAENAVKLYKGNELQPYALGTLAQVLMASENYADALDPLFKSLNLTKDNATKKRRLKEIVKCYKMVGESEKAKEYQNKLDNLK